VAGQRGDFFGGEIEAGELLEFRIFVADDVERLAIVGETRVAVATFSPPLE